jgi:cytosine/adenosine deaminase-related metal-dependent hydrolase
MQKDSAPDRSERADGSCRAGLIQAAWVAPMDGPVVRHGGVVHADGRVIAVGIGSQLHRRYPDAVVQDLGKSLLLPGLVNAHVHLELSDCTPGARPTDGFVGWLMSILRRTHMEPAAMEASVQQGTLAGTAQCLRFGVTTVGDISRQCHLTRPILRQSPLRVVSYGEVQAMGQRRHLLDERLAIASDATSASERLTIGISPHAPYSIEPEGYRRCLDLARQRQLPLATHLAESRDEAAFLADHSGELYRLWQFIGRWDDAVPTFTGGPIRFAQALGLIEYPTALAHVNYCDDDELAVLAGGRASVVYCPRTHAYFGHPPHRWRDMLERGINVAVGTDSCASSPDLNLLDDLHLLHRLAPQVSAATVWQMATVRAARAIDQESALGTLAPGKAADMVAFPIDSADPLTEVLDAPRHPRQVWVGGLPQLGTPG